MMPQSLRARASARVDHEENAMRSVRLLPLVLLAAASAVGAEDAAKPAAPPRAKAPAGAQVFIVSPADGATVGPDFKVEFGAKNISVAPSTNNAPGTGHHHLLVDAAELPPGDAPIPNDATHRHYGKGQTEDTIHLAPGEHTLQLDCADALHMQFDPPIVSKKITVHVK
jgi:hypothetical protein